MRLKLFRNCIPRAPFVGWSYGVNAFYDEKVFTMWIGGLILVVLL